LVLLVLVGFYIEILNANKHQKISFRFLTKQQNNEYCFLQIFFHRIG
jgi:hypothetical protein